MKASLTGSIIGNLLLVLGASVLIGGLRHGTQTFSSRIAGANAALLVVAVIGLFVPAVFAFTTSDAGVGTITEESVLVSIALIVGYVLSLVYQFSNPAETLGGHGEPEGHAGPGLDRPHRDRRPAAAPPALLAVLSEILVGSIERFIEQFGLTAVLRRRRAHPDHRQPRRAPRRGPARGKGQDGVRDGRLVRLEPAGRAVRGARARAARRRSSASP